MAPLAWWGNPSLYHLLTPLLGHADRIQIIFRSLGNAES